MPDVFLSYNREDQTDARRFAEALEADGLSVWWDTALRSGENYDEVTEQALRTAKAVVVLWSKRSVVSRWVRAEATLADRKKTLVPAMIELCERNGKPGRTLFMTSCRAPGLTPAPYQSQPRRPDHRPGPGVELRWHRAPPLIFPLSPRSPRVRRRRACRGRRAGIGQ